MAQLGEKRIYVLEAELKMDASKTVKNENIGSEPGYMLARYMDWKCRNV